MKVGNAFWSLRRSRPRGVRGFGAANFSAFDAADMALLERDWHVAYIRLSDLYGCPYAAELMEGSAPGWPRTLV